jgi:1,4-dihydroxy-2-naphthoyl-CoA synthase
MKHVRVDRRGSTLQVTIDRPPANAITPEVGEELHEAYSMLRDDAGLRVGIVTGAGGRIFCAGWDLKEVALATDPAVINDAVMNKPGGFAGVTEFWDLQKPVIAAVNGAAVGVASRSRWLRISSSRPSTRIFRFPKWLEASFPTPARCSGCLDEFPITLQWSSCSPGAA